MFSVKFEVRHHAAAIVGHRSTCTVIVDLSQSYSSVHVTFVADSFAICFAPLTLLLKDEFGWLDIWGQCDGPCLWHGHAPLATPRLTFSVGIQTVWALWRKMPYAYRLGVVCLGLSLETSSDNNAVRIGSGPCFSVCGLFPLKGRLSCPDLGSTCSCRALGSQA